LTVSLCPACGQKIRKGWRRCPECRLVLAEATMPVAKAVAPAPPSRRTLGILAASAATLLLIGLPSVLSVAAPWSDAPPSVASHKTAARRSPEPQRSTDPREAEQNDAVDRQQAGGVAYTQGDLSGALEQYQSAVTSSPDDPEAHSNLGQVLVRVGRVPEALDQFDEAVRLDANRWSYRFNRARAYGLLDRWSDAATEYRAAGQLFPDDYATQYNLGLALIRVREFAAAAEALEHAVSLAPDKHDFLITLGTAYVGAEQPERARATFERFLAAAPSDPEAPRARALLDSMSASSPSGSSPSASPR